MIQEKVEKEIFNEYGYSLFQRRNLNPNHYGVSNKELNVILSRLTKQNKLSKFKGVPGVYQFVKWADFFGTEIPVNKASRSDLLNFLYLQNNQGYYYGSSLLNKLGLSTQVPRVLEISTINVSRKTTKTIENLTVTLKPVVYCVTEKVKPLLAAVDTLLQPSSLKLEGVSSIKIIDKLAEYAMKEEPNWENVRKILVSYPEKDLKKIVEVGFYDQLFRSGNKLSSVS